MCSVVVWCKTSWAQRGTTPEEGAQHSGGTTPEFVAKNSDSPFSKCFLNFGTFFRDFIAVPTAENAKCEQG